LVAAVYGGRIYSSTDSGVTWMQLNSDTRNWYSIACSADGTKLVAVDYAGLIYTAAPSSSTPGPAGYLQGNQNTAIELQYVGNGKFLPISFVGNLKAF
jgi:photosystem II stability/assembly factor-like uncharacterized protein